MQGLRRHLRCLGSDARTPPPAAFADAANYTPEQYDAMYARSVTASSKFWLHEAEERLTWSTAPTVFRDGTRAKLEEFCESV